MRYGSSTEDPFDWPDVDLGPRSTEEVDDFGRALAGAADKKKAKAVSHTSRTRAWCQKRGWIVAPCEIKDSYHQGGLSFMGKKHDLFGLFDMIAIDTVQNRIVGIQIVSTSRNKAAKASFNDHLRKMCSTDTESKSCSPFLTNLRAWLATGNPILVLDWEQRDKVGSKEWFEVERWVRVEMIEAVLARRRRAS